MEQRGYSTALLLALATGVGRAQAQPPPARVLHTPASAIGPALASVLALDSEDRSRQRFVSAYHVEEKDLPALAKALAFGVNSLSRVNVMTRPVPVPGAGGRLWRIDLGAYRIPRSAWERLASVGSGRAPFPEPYFHLAVEKEEPVYENRRRGYWSDGRGGNLGSGYRTPLGAYRWVSTGTERVRVGTKKVFALAQAPWLPEDDVARLCAETDSDAPVLRIDWLLYYGFLEPRYHELLGLGESEAELRKLTTADAAAADKHGVVVRGAVLDSEVAPNNRALEREPSILRYGMAYYWRSIDYNTSIEGGDLLADLLDPGQAHEIIYSLPNGLQGYYLTDGKGRRIDRATSDFARDRRNPYRWVEVEIRNCVGCHAQGILPIRDAVREDASGPLALAVRKKARKSRRAERIRDRYFAVDIGQIVTRDQQSYADAVRAVNGLAPAANAAAFQKILLGYEANVSLETLERETGYPRGVIRAVVERSGGSGLHHSVARLVRLGAVSRRDHIESAGYGQLMRLLMKVPRVPPQGPPPRAKEG